MSESFSYSREPIKGKDLGESVALHLLGFMQSGRQRVETLRNFTFTNRFIGWVKREFEHELAQRDFETALQVMYGDSRIIPIAYMEGSSSRRKYDSQVILQHVEEFAITPAGLAFLKQHTGESSQACAEGAS